MNILQRELITLALDALAETYKKIQENALELDKLCVQLRAQISDIRRLVKER